MLIKVLAATLWLIFMGLTACIVIRNGLEIGGWDGWLSIGIGIGCSLLGSFGSIATFSIWDVRKGAARGAAGVALALLCWVAGEAAVILNELSWRSAAIESKVDDKEDADLARDGARKRLKKAQDALASLPEVRSDAAIASDEGTALAEAAKWNHEKTTVGRVTKNCTDTEHYLYTRCTKVLALRAEKENAKNVLSDRDRLTKERDAAAAELKTKPEVGSVDAASQWLADRSGHDRKTWETVGTVIMLLVFALGRDAPGCVVGALRDDRKAETPLAQTPEEILRRTSIEIKRVDIHRVVVWDRQPEPCTLSFARVIVPAIEHQSEPEPITAPPAAKEVTQEPAARPDEPILALPAPETKEEPKNDPEPKSPKRKPTSTKQDLGANVTVLHPIDRRPGWETRDWLRETLANGPQKRADIVRLGGEKGISEASLDRAAKAMPEVSITPGKGKRPAIWEIKKQPGQKRQKTAL